LEALNVTDDNQLASFLIEEFKQNWSYIRHIEEIRLKHANIFLIIAGAVISVLAFLVQIPDSSLGQQTLNEIVTNYRIPILFATLFLFLYGFVLCIFLARQKKGYEHYRIVNSEIRNWFVTKYNEKDSFSFEKQLSGTRTYGELLKSTFFCWYILTALVSLFALSICCITFFSWAFPSWLFTDWIIVSIFTGICFLIVEILIFFEVNRNRNNNYEVS